jgi:hypothetical protein
MYCSALSDYDIAAVGQIQFREPPESKEMAMSSSIDRAYPTAVARAAVLAAGVMLAGCGEMYNRGDFEALVKNKSDKEVAARIGKPFATDENKPGQVRWTYTSRTFSIGNGNKRDAKTVVIFSRASDGTLRATEVLYD